MLNALCICPHTIFCSHHKMLAIYYKIPETVQLLNWAAIMNSPAELHSPGLLITIQRLKKLMWMLGYGNTSPLIKVSLRLINIKPVVLSPRGSFKDPSNLGLVHSCFLNKKWIMNEMVNMETKCNLNAPLTGANHQLLRWIKSNPRETGGFKISMLPWGYFLTAPSMSLFVIKLAHWIPEIA